MSKHQTRSRTSLRLPTEVKIKVEKDYEEEDTIAVIQPVVRFDASNGIKQEAEIIVNDESQNELCEDEKYEDEVLYSTHSNNIVDLSDEKSNTEYSITELFSVKEEDYEVELKEIEIKITKADIEIAEEAKINEIHQQSSPNGSRSTNIKNASSTSKTTLENQQKYFNIFEECNKKISKNTFNRNSKPKKSCAKVATLIPSTVIENSQINVKGNLENPKEPKFAVTIEEFNVKAENDRNESRTSKRSRNNRNKKINADRKSSYNQKNLDSFLKIVPEALKIESNTQNFKIEPKSESSTKPTSENSSHSSKFPFKCDLCPKSFQWPIGLRNHRVFHNTEKFPCKRCKIIFKSERGLKNHVCPICEICGRQFKDNPHLLRHVMYVHNDKSLLQLFECDLCDMKFKYKKSIQHHILQHMEITKNARFICDHCGKIYKKKVGLRQHMILHATATFSCKRCGLWFKKITPFRQHKCLICNYCSKIFSATNKLSDHIRNMHTDESLLSLYSCDICGKQFKYKNTIIRHVLNHQEEAKFKCKVCGKLWKSHISLKNHFRSCHGMEPINCKICNKKMKRQAIYSHMRFVHTDQRNFPCKICGASFKTKDSLRKHEDIHDKKYKCEECGRMFAAQYELLDHAARHKNPNAYQCKVCKNSYSTKTSLNTHMKLHKGIVRNIKCPHCPFVTHRQQSLKYHLTTHEKRDKKMLQKKKWIKCAVCGALLSNKKSLMSHHSKVHPSELFVCDLCGVVVKTKHTIKVHFELKHLGQADNNVKISAKASTAKPKYNRWTFNTVDVIEKMK